MNILSRKKIPTACCCTLQAKASVQASAASDKKDQLAAVTHQQTDTARARQHAQQGLKAAQSALAELDSQRQQVDKDLKSLLRQVPELGSMMARYHTRHVNPLQIINVIRYYYSNMIKA